jgi:hypothetical protein
MLHGGNRRLGQVYVTKTGAGSADERPATATAEPTWEIAPWTAPQGGTFHVDVPHGSPKSGCVPIDTY